jgi:hypothetical protein
MSVSVLWNLYFGRKTSKIVVYVIFPWVKQGAKRKNQFLAFQRHETEFRCIKLYLNVLLHAMRTAKTPRDIMEARKRNNLSQLVLNIIWTSQSIYSNLIVTK